MHDKVFVVQDDLPLRGRLLFNVDYGFNFLKVLENYVAPSYKNFSTCDGVKYSTTHYN